MIISSGNVVHNLRLIERSRPDIGFDWTLRFDDTVGRQLTKARDGILAAVEHADFHFVCAGLRGTPWHKKLFSV
jgi:4,5-DOPA dioxygenase extradiol